jgi:hypothetical protein
MRNVRTTSFSELFGLNFDKANKLDTLANKREYKKEKKLDLKIKNASVFIAEKEAELFNIQRRLEKITKQDLVI